MKINSVQIYIQTSLFLNDNQTTCDCPETVPESDFIIFIDDDFLVVSQIAEQEKLFLETVTVELVLSLY